MILPSLLLLAQVICAVGLILIFGPVEGTALVVAVAIMLVSRVIGYPRPSRFLNPQPDALLSPKADPRLEASVGSILSPRERQVCALVLRGLVIKEAAFRLGISTNTARNHLARVYQKLGVTTRAELVHRFQRLGEDQPGLRPSDQE